MRRPARPEALEATRQATGEDWPEATWACGRWALLLLAWRSHQRWWQRRWRRRRQQQLRHHHRHHHRPPRRPASSQRPARRLRPHRPPAHLLSRSRFHCQLQPSWLRRLCPVPLYPVALCPVPQLQLQPSWLRRLCPSCQRTCTCSSPPRSPHPRPRSPSRRHHRHLPSARYWQEGQLGAGWQFARRRWSLQDCPERERQRSQRRWQWR